jgi:uncharacterized protein
MTTMTSEQLLLEKWHELPEPQQKIVLAFVNKIHAQKLADTQLPETQPAMSPPDYCESAAIPESERQRVIARVMAARAARPQMLEQMRIRQQEGWEAARKVAKMLKDDFGVERTVLFGSLLNHEHMHNHSDIDLAVWGLAKAQETKAWTAANYILGPYNFPPIDLVPFEKAYPHIREAIETEGVEL